MLSLRFHVRLCQRTQPLAVDADYNSYDIQQRPNLIETCTGGALATKQCALGPVLSHLSKLWTGSIPLPLPTSIQHGSYQPNMRKHS
jgi:hypothetical protein